MNLHGTSVHKNHTTILCMCAREGPLYSVRV